MSTAKEEVRRLLDSLPDDASLEDVQYAIYVWERISRGRKEASEGKLIDEEGIDEPDQCRSPR